MKYKNLKKTSKRTNIPLRRNFTLIYYRLINFSKIAAVLVLCLFFFTNYLSFVNRSLVGLFDESFAKIGFELENVIIEGEQNIDRRDILGALGADTGTPIFAINIKQIKERLEKNSWVKKVVVERQLPSNIYIKLLERIPIAIWQINQKLYLIDNEGYKITNKIPNSFSDLPHLVGIDANIYADELIKNLNNFSALFGKVKSAVRYGERRWNLNLEQNITVKMPERNFILALNYLNELNQANKLFDVNYKVIDLRDSNKFYIEKF